MPNLKFVVIEYIPREMRFNEGSIVRMDGHYSDRGDALGVARLMADSPISDGSRIVVAEVVEEVKRPSHWSADD